MRLAGREQGRLRPGQHLCLLLVVALLSACHFQPLYQKHQLTEGTSGELARIRPVVAGRTRNAQILRTELEDLFGRTELAAYDHLLEMSFNNDSYPVAVNADGAVARFNAVVTVDYRLKDAAGVTLTHGEMRRLASYNVVDSDYATYKANRAAYERAIRSLAEALRNRLVLYVRAHPELIRPPAAAETVESAADEKESL